MNTPKRPPVYNDEPRLTASQWAELAATGFSAPPADLRADSPALVHGFHLRLNAWEWRALQMVADVDRLSKQKIASRGLHAYLEQRLRIARLVVK